MSRQALLEAVARERARCLWCLDQILVDLQRELDKKLLIESKRYVIEVRVKLARAIVLMARRGILTGVEPKNLLPKDLPKIEPPKESPDERRSDQDA